MKAMATTIASRAGGSEETLDRLQEELRTHAIELELQNEELRGSRARLESSQGEFERLFDLAPVAYLVISETGCVLRANMAARRLLNEEHLESQRFSRFIRAPRIERFEALLKDLDDEPRCAELELLSHSVWGYDSTIKAHAVRLLYSDQPCTLLCLEDITELRQAIRRSIDSEAGLRHLIDVSPDAMAVVQQGSIVLGNAALRDLVGCDKDALLGSSFLQYVRADERHALESAFQLSIQRGSTGYVQLHLAENHRAVEARFTRLKYEGTASVLVVARDITERMRAAAELEHSSRLASLGMLVAGVAHEINNPLAFVLPGLDDALERLSSVPPEVLFGVGTVGDISELIREAKAGVERVAAIVKDLKVFHKVKESMEPVELNQIVVDTLKMAVPKLGHRVTVVRDLGQLPPVIGNVGRLAQIVLNLLLNASQSMPEGRPRAENRVSVRTWYGVDGVHLEVVDNGLGIEQADLKKLFDPFFSKRSGGTGLGLTVCASLVREMNGWIEVDSQPARGTRFVLRFPRAEQPAPSRSQTRRRVRPIDGLSLLVVDDEPLIFRTISRVLGSSVRLTQARSGNDAIQQLAEGLRVDVVITDLVMPNGSGVELFEWISKHRRELASCVVFMTGMAHPETRGAMPDCPHLQKPFSAEQVRQLVASLPVKAPPLRSCQEQQGHK